MTDTEQVVINLSMVGLIALIGAYFKGLAKPGIDAKKLLEEHIEKCNEIPKSLILERLNNLTTVMINNNHESTLFRTEIREKLEDQNKTFYTMNSILQKLVGRAENEDRNK